MMSKSRTFVLQFQQIYILAFLFPEIHALFESPTCENQKENSEPGSKKVSQLDPAKERRLNQIKIQEKQIPIPKDRKF